ASMVHRLFCFNYVYIHSRTRGTSFMTITIPELFLQSLYLLLATGFAVGGIALLIAVYRRPRIAISKWAASHQYTLVRYQYRTLRRGPFFRFGRWNNLAPVFS